MSPKNPVDEGHQSGSSSKGGPDPKEECEIRREWIFGLRSEVTGAVVHLNNDTILYPAGHSLVVYGISQPRQSFAILTPGSDPIDICISDKRDLLAICFSGQMASVEIWNTESLEREKVLACPEVVSKRFVSASFSAENKMLVAQGGEPDWTLVLFVVEKGKVFSILRLTDTQEFGLVTSVRFHPQDPGILSVVGDGILRMMKLHDKLLKTWGYPGGHEHYCVCQEWIDIHILLIGTNQATILVLEDGELRATLNVVHPDLTRWGKSSDEEEKGMSSIAELGKTLLPRHRTVTSLRRCEGGFLCACGPDKIFVFHKSENIHEFFTQKLIMKVCEPTPAARVSGRGDHTITCLSVTPDQKHIVAATHTGQLFINKLPSQEESQMQTLVFTPLHSLCHEGSIVAMACCLWKPMILTTGRDKTLRAWDLTEHKLLFHHAFKEDVYSVALHPTGLHVVLGLTDALHLYHVMFDGVRHYCEFKIRRCALTEFSWGGQYLVATDSNLLTLFSTIYLKRITTLKGHTNKITGVAWLPDDSSLVSCSADGGIFGWDLQTSSVAWELRTDECQFLTNGMVVVESEGPTILSGSKSMIYHLNIGQMVEEGPFTFGSATSIAFSPAKALVIVGTTDGTLIVMPFPSILNSVPTKLKAHASAITKDFERKLFLNEQDLHNYIISASGLHHYQILVTRDEERMISSAKDGIIIIWRLPCGAEDDGKPIAALEKVSQLPKIPEMLVAQHDIVSMLNKLSKLESYVDYLKKDKTHHLKLKMKEFESVQDKMKKDNERVEESMRVKIEELENALIKEKKRHEETALKSEENFVERETILKEELRQKLLYEYAKQDNLEKRIEELKLKNEEDKETWEEKAEKKLRENLQEQENTIRNLNHQLQKVTSELEQERQEGAQILKLVEASTEVELSKARTSFHQQLAEGRQKATALREEKASLQRKIVTLETETEDLQRKVRLLELSRTDLEGKISSLELNLISLKKEISDRNKIIALREEELSKKRDLLEEQKKSLILQEHQIAWFKSQLQPTEDSLREKVNQIQQMEEEISDCRLQVEGRDRQVRHLSQRLSATQGNCQRTRRRLLTAQTRSTRFQSDVALTSKVIHNPKKLKEAVKSLADKHLEKGSPNELWTRTFLSSEGDPAMKEPGDDVQEISEDSYRELLRQRQLLEKSVETLQKKSAKDISAHRSKVSSLIKENKFLLDQLKVTRSKLSEKEAASMGPKEAPKDLRRRKHLPRMNVSVPSAPKPVIKLVPE